MRLLCLAALGLSALASALSLSPQFAEKANANTRERPDWGVKYFNNCPGPYDIQNDNTECTLLRNKLTSKRVVLDSNWEFRTALHTNEASEIQIDLYPYDESFGNMITGGVEICVWRAFKDSTLTSTNQPERMAAEEQKPIYEYAEEEFGKCLAVIPVPKGHVRSAGKPTNTYVIPLPALEHNADRTLWKVYIHANTKNTAYFTVNAYDAQYSPITYGDSESITKAMTTMHVPKVKDVEYEEIEIDVMYDGEYVTRDEYMYYKLMVPIPIPSRMDIYMSPVFGDPDIYVTLDGTDPSIENSAYDSAMQVGTEVVIIRDTDDGPGQTMENCPDDGVLEFCEINIAVYGFTNSIYSVIVVEDGSLIPLTRNHPFIDYTVGGEEHANFYMYTPEQQWWEEQTRFTFVVTPFAGDPDIFVSSSKKGSPLPTNIEDSCWHSTSTRVEVVDIFPPKKDDDDEDDEDECYCHGEDCVYYIGVVGYGAATYSIVAEESHEGSDSFIVLIDGVTQSGFVAEGRNQYYKYILPPAEAGTEEEDRRIFLNVSPVSGDPDLYVSLGGAIPDPEGEYDYRSSSTGPEQIVMRTSDAVWKDSECSDPTKVCEIIIAVHGYASSYFDISITGSESTVISEGQSIQGSASDGKMTFYRFQSVQPGYGITVSVLPLRGNPELFIGNDAHPSTFPVGEEDGKYLWKSVGEGLELVYIDPEDESRCDSPCWYSLGVSAEGNFSQFVITVIVDDGSAPFVNPGEPIYASVREGEHQRYQAMVDRSLGYLEVIVSPMFGNPDLYMSLNNKDVSKDDHQWASYSVNADENILVTSDDPRYESTCGQDDDLPPEEQPPCIANVAVYGETNALYIFTISDGLRDLLDGIATVGRVPAKDYSYFRFTMHTRDPFTVSVTPTSGNPDMYISPTVKPTKEDHVWEAVSVGPEVITITPDDPEFNDCELPCEFFIGVYGVRENQQSSFRIIANSHDATTMLSDGVSVVGYTRPKVMSYFSFYVPSIPEDIDNEVAIEFTVTPLGSVTSEVSFYVGNIVDEDDGVVQYPHVLCQDEECDEFIVENAHWDSTRSSTRREISIRGNDPNLAPGTYILGVYSNNGASVSVMASTGNKNKVLYPGIPLQDSTSEGQYTYYLFPMSHADRNSDVVVLATPISGDPDMYVSYHRENPRPGAGPDKTSDKSSISSFGVERIVIEWEENEECQAALEAPDGSCAVYIGIHGFTDASYSIVAHLATDDDDPDLIGIMLEDGIPLADQVVMNRQKFYYVDVSLPDGYPYMIYVRSMYGDPDVYVTTSGERPGIEEGEYDYASIHAESDDIINIVPGTPGYKNKALVWTLVTGFSSTAYLITFSSADTVTMTSDGQSISNTAIAGGYNYYSFHVDDPSASIKFAVTAFSGDPDIYASVWQDRSPNFRPKKDPSMHTWAGTVLGSNILVIDPDDPDKCDTACTYIVAVYCASVETCRYHFTATATGDVVKPISLVNGEPLTYSVRNDGIVYFGFNSGGGISDMTFSLRGDIANLQMVITNEYDPENRPPGELPNPDDPTSYHWSDVGGTGSIVITQEDEEFDPLKSYYTIAVTPPPGAPEGEIYFTITASKNDRIEVLRPGIASSDVLLAEGTNQRFRFDLHTLDQDFVLEAHVMFGNLTLAVTTNTSDISCESPTSCPNAIWSSINTKDEKIIINAPKDVRLNDLISSDDFSPCVGPYVTGKCTEDDWKTGSMYIAVYADKEVYFTLTAQTEGDIILEDGKPQFAYTGNNRKPTFRYRTNIRDLSFPDYRISFSGYDNEDGSPLAYYITGCESKECDEEPENRSPGPDHSHEYGIIPGNKSTDVFLTRFSKAYCTPSTGGTCFIFISVWPTGKGCEDPSGESIACETVFSVNFQTQSNNARTVINYGSIDRQILPLIGNVGPAKTSLFAIYLDPKKPVTMNVDLEACGPGYPVLYACNAQPSEDVTPCKVPSIPGPMSGNGYTSAGETAPNGIATITEFDVQSPAFYVSVIGESELGNYATSNNDESWSYILHVSAGETLYLYTPTDNEISVTHVDGTSIELGWKTAEIFDHLDEYVGPASKISYEIYAAEAGFNKDDGSPSVIPTTSCGLIRWSLAANFNPIAVPGLDHLSHVVTGLKAHTDYEFNIIAYCDEDCWEEQSVRIRTAVDEALAALDEYETAVLNGNLAVPLSSLKAMADERVLGQQIREQLRNVEDITDVANLREALLDKKEVTLNQRHSVQRVAYSVATARTGEGVPPKKDKKFPKAGIIGILLMIAILVGGFFLYRRYRQGRDSQRTTQYSYLDLEDSLPSSGGSAGASIPAYSSQGGYEPPSPSDDSGGGLLGSLQSALRLPSGRTNNKVPLAEEDYSSLHSQVEGYL